MQLNTRVTQGDDPQTPRFKPPNKMRLARLKKGFSQAQMADRLGITQATYSRIESGLIQQPESEDLLQRIAEILEVPKHDLFEEEDSETPTPTTQQAHTTLDPKEIPAMLRDLKGLLDDGVITEEEFRHKKRELLARL